MKHDVLGDVELSDGRTFDAIAMVRLGLHNVRIGIIRDGEPLESALDFAADVASRLVELDKLARGIATANLRGVYNNGWNEYDEVQEDGSLRTVTNPELSEAEFDAKLSLQAVNVIAACCINFFYDNENMFWGHSIVVTSLDGTDLSKAHAELFG